MLISPLLLFIAIWTIFTFSKTLVINLFMLLLASLSLPLMFMSELKLFWPCGLLLILMSTGLIVIFAYMVSLHTKSETVLTQPTYCLLMILVPIYFILMWYSSLSTNKMLFSFWKVYVNPMLSLILLLILLILVVSFIRNVYSKGGGFRKKF